MRTVNIEVTVRLIILNELNYVFQDTTGKADVVDTEITDCDIKEKLYV